MLKKHRNKNLGRAKLLYIMLLFPVVWYILICYVPMFGIAIAFQKYSVYKGVFGSEWVGLQNFRKFLNDAYFWQVLRNTFLLGFFNLLINFPLPIILALMFNELSSGPYKRVTQTISYLPYFVSTVALVSIITSILSPSRGVVNAIIESLGGTPISFMLEPDWFRPIYILLSAWRGTGWGTIIYLAAMAGINPELYQVAEIDGAGRFRRIWNITLPSIAPTITILFLLAIPGILGADFETVLLLQKPLTLNVSDVMATYVYRRGLQDQKFDYATAVSLTFSIISMLIIFVSNTIARRKGDVSLW